MMVWTQKHLHDNVAYGKRVINRFLSDDGTSRPVEGEVFKIGVVGGGPKGLYALDHLLHQLKRSGVSARIVIYWFNASSDFGCGPNYQTDQPEYLLINYCIGHIDAWHPAYPRGEDQMNLLDWINKYKETEVLASPKDFASRALVGSYLQDCTARVLQSCPDHIRIALHTKTVTEVTYTEQQFTVRLSDGQALYALDNLLLTTGHAYQNKPLVQDSSGKVSKNYIANAYPVSKLAPIHTGSAVGVIGMGLTFIDAVLTLTEGRGGRFDEDGCYHPSGKEPIIYPFSRNNIPILARDAIFGSETYRLHFFDKPWQENMDLISQARKIDFEVEVLPLLAKEIQFAYYSRVLNTRDPLAVEQHLQTLDKADTFELAHLLFPVLDASGSISSKMLARIRDAIREAERGEAHSPLMAAAAVWRELTSLLRPLYQAGGFTGRSQKFFDLNLYSAFCRISFGPPTINMKKILAIAEAGIIRFEFASQVRVQYNAHTGAFNLISKEVELSVDYLIDARIASPSLANSNSVLYQNLWAASVIEPFDNEGYQPGCAHMDLAGQSMRSDGARIPLFFYGTNTEGFMLDNDSLSRTANDLGIHWAKKTMQQITEKGILKNVISYQ